MSSNHKNEKKCPDCHQCQVCSENRCRLCRKDGSGVRVSELGTGFTHGEYLKWKRKKAKGLDLIDGACKACSNKMAVLKEIEGQGIKLLGEMTGHPSMARYKEEGFEIITF